MVLRSKIFCELTRGPPRGSPANHELLVAVLSATCWPAVVHLAAVLFLIVNEVVLKLDPEPRACLVFTSPVKSRADVHLYQSFRSGPSHVSLSLSAVQATSHGDSHWIGTQLQFHCTDCDKPLRPHFIACCGHVITAQNSCLNCPLEDQFNTLALLKR
jgi:hypothetical protein